MRSCVDVCGCVCVAVRLCVCVCVWKRACVQPVQRCRETDPERQEAIQDRVPLLSTARCCLSHSDSVHPLHTQAERGGEVSDAHGADNQRRLSSVGK